GNRRIPSARKAERHFRTLVPPARSGGHAGDQRRLSQRRADRFDPETARSGSSAHRSTTELSPIHGGEVRGKLPSKSAQTLTSRGRRPAVHGPITRFAAATLQCRLIVPPRRANAGHKIRKPR